MELYQERSRLGMLGAYPAPAQLRTRSWDPARLCRYRAVSQPPWLDAQATGQVLMATGLQRKQKSGSVSPLKHPCLPQAGSSPAKCL